MDIKIILLVLLAILLVFALIKKLLFLALAVLILGFAYYTGLTEAAILFAREIVDYIVNASPPPILLQSLAGMAFL